jgi:hypothetical protein
MTTNLELPESYDRFININDRVRHKEEIIIYSAHTFLRSTINCSKSDRTNSNYYPRSTNY